MRHRLPGPVSRVAAGTMLAVSGVAFLALGGCAVASGLLGEERPGLQAFNGTDIPIELWLNGELDSTLGPDEGMAIVSTWRMPDLPWAVEARTKAGRVLLTMTVTADDLALTGYKVVGVALPAGGFEVRAGTSAP